MNLHKRALAQGFFGILLLLIIAQLLVQTLFKVIFNTDLSASNYNRTDFVILIVCICFINVYHVLVYVSHLLKSLKEAEEIESPLEEDPSKNRIDYLVTLPKMPNNTPVFISRIAYFELSNDDETDLKLLSAYTWEGEKHILSQIKSLSELEKLSNGLHIKLNRNLLVNRLAFVEKPIKTINNQYLFKLDTSLLPDVYIHKTDVSAIMEAIEENMRYHTST